MQLFLGRAFLLLSLTTFVANCGGGGNQAPSDIGKSFAVAKPDSFQQRGGLAVSGYVVAIDRSALGKEFLLQGSLLQQPVLPMPSGLKSRVVSFKERGDSLAMIESTKGQALSTDFPMNNIIATFPIVKVEDSLVYFDFAKGMSGLIVAFDWYASDFQGPDFVADYTSVPVISSFLDSASFSQNNALVIRQIAQLDMKPSFMSDFRDRQSIELKYYISPYRPNPAYTPVKSVGYFERMGFFEINPQLQNEKSVVYATKFDSSKPIVYAISANTPTEYRQAIRDAVLYWNTSFGSDVVKVIDAPEGVTAPDADYNVIQWVQYDDAGFAYADAQMDPLTGEILHSQIMLTSAFAFHGKAKAKEILSRLAVAKTTEMEGRKVRDFSKLERAPIAEKKKALTLSGFQSSNSCFRDETKRLSTALMRLNERNLDDSEILKISQDYVREVVAHEVGHTLGLRHNFAGSLSMNYDVDERPAIFKNYLDTGLASRDIRPTSSVMDYNAFEEAVLAGSQIQQGGIAYDYDHKAIQFLYSGKKFQNSEVPLFCTDSHMRAMADCLAFDVGYSPMENGKLMWSTGLEDLPHLIAQIMVQVRTLPEDQRFDFEDIWLTGQDLAYYLNDAKIGTLFGMMVPKYSYLRVQRSFSSVTQWNLGEFLAKLYGFVDERTSVNGGLKALYPELAPNYAEKAIQKVEQLINDEAYTTAASLNGQKFAFTDSEKERVMRIVRVWFTESESVAALDDMMIAAFASDKIAASESKTEFYFKKAGRYLLTLSDQPPLEFKGVKLIRNSDKRVDLKLPQFAYSNWTRQMVALILPTSKGEGALAWASTAKKAALKKELQAIMKNALGGVESSQIDSYSIPYEVSAWISSVQFILSSLNE